MLIFPKGRGGGRGLLITVLLSPAWLLEGPPIYPWRLPSNIALCYGSHWAGSNCCLNPQDSSAGTVI